MNYVLSAIYLVIRFAFAIPVLIILLRLFTRTQMRSFLWLIATLVAWPVLVVGFSTVLPFFVTRMAAAQALNVASTITIYRVVYLAEAIIGGTLALVSVYMLEREITARMLPSTPPAPPQL